MKRAWLPLAVLASLTVQAQACSVCIAHALGAAIHAVGSQTIKKGSTVVGLTFSSFEKSQDGENPGTTETHKQTEENLQVIHGLSDQWMLRAVLPYVQKSLSVTGDPTVRTQGFGDLSLGATYQVKPHMDSKVLLAWNLDLKLPTGANSLADATGARLDEHSQLGTGSTDWSLGVVATTETGSGDLLFAGVRARVNGTNGSGYHYGNTLFYNLGLSHRLDKQSSLVAELNGRFSEKDHLGDGTVDEDSGGHLGYLSLSYRRSLSPDFGLIATYQVPVLRNLNGSQSESGLLTIGVFQRL